MNFESLVGRVNLIQDALQAQAAHAVNLSLTARNWLVGFYIVQFEQHDEDRAKYGEKLLKQLAKSLNRRGLGERRLHEYRLTYQVYPQLGVVVAEYVSKNGQEEILRLPTAKLQTADLLTDEKLRLLTAKLAKEEWQTPADWLFYRLSATHLVLLANLKDPLERAFYEQETIRSCWTVTELDRQVSSSQLNLYMNYYKHEVMQQDDNHGRAVRSDDGGRIDEK